MFTGGRGSTALAGQLGGDRDIELTLLVNGYDDGLSTGEVRRFLGDCLGPSDFRKNATRLAKIRQSCAAGLIDLMDLRFPDNPAPELVDAVADLMLTGTCALQHPFPAQVAALLDSLDGEARSQLAGYYRNIAGCMEVSEQAFDFNDCSIGNLVFAGCFLDAGRNFNTAVDRYAEMLGIEAGIIVNVTNGENAWLVGIDGDGRYLESEAEIVDAEQPGTIRDFFLIHKPLEPKPPAEPNRSEWLQAHAAPISLNPKAAQAITNADLILYAPGTQYSSLFPSYITPGLGECIANNLHALKLLVTNLYEDAETRHASATDIIERALYYLREKGRRSYPSPCLMTHYLVNAPASVSSDHIPVGHMDTLEDPRLLRISNYEDGVTGRHHADKILTPFIESLKRGRNRESVAVLLMDGESTDKTCQSLLELIRAGADRLPQFLSVYHTGEISDVFASHEDLPFGLTRVDNGTHGNSALVQQALADGHDYLCLFESSGMYHGHDIVALISNLEQQHLDAAWGSRRLSTEDVRASYRFRYRHRLATGIISYIGSYLLSLAYLTLYGRYVSDTLSGVRLVKSGFVQNIKHLVEHRCFNQHLLSELLRANGKVFEIPVDFIPMSPDKVKRTSALDGIASLWVILKSRLFSSNPTR